MKRILPAIFAFAFLQAKAQIQIINQSLTDTTKNFLYIGAENHILISGKGFNEVTNPIQISGGGASIYKQASNDYLVRTTVVTDECKIWITNKNGKTIAEKKFNVRYIPEFEVTLAGFKDTTLSRNKILLNSFLSVILPNCYYQHNFLVTAFTATFIENNDSIVIVTNGNLLSQEQKDWIKKTNSGSRIWFNDIRAVGPDSRTRKLKPFWIIIE
jgi:hypothetical protein